MKDMRKELAERVDGMDDELRAWMRENEGSLYASESDRAYDAIQALTDLRNILYETLNEEETKEE